LGTVGHDHQLCVGISPVLAYGLDRHVVFGENVSDGRQYTGAVGDLEGEVVPRHHLADFADGTCRVAGLTRAHGPTQPVPGHSDKVPENCTRRR
jgi:hypothetical protein